MIAERCQGSRQYVNEETVQIVGWRATVACPDCAKKVYAQMRSRRLVDMRLGRVRVGNHH